MEEIDEEFWRCIFYENISKTTYNVVELVNDIDLNNKEIIDKWLSIEESYYYKHMLSQHIKEKVKLQILLIEIKRLILIKKYCN